MSYSSQVIFLKLLAISTLSPAFSIFQTITGLKNSSHKQINLQKLRKYLLHCSFNSTVPVFLKSEIPSIFDPSSFIHLKMLICEQSVTIVCFSTGTETILPLRENWQYLETFWLSRLVCTAVIQWFEVRDVARHLSASEMAFHNKEFLAPNVHSILFKKHSVQ